MVTDSHIKILIVNLHSSRNAGDDVLTHVTMDILLHHFPDASIKLAMNDPLSYEGVGNTVGSFMTWLKPSNHFSLSVFVGPIFIYLSFLCAISYRIFKTAPLWLFPQSHRRLLTAYLEADFVVSSAGNFLYSSGRLGFAFVIAIYTMLFGWFVGKPVYMMPQTIGPLKHNWEGFLIKIAISRLRLVFVRDPISMELLRALNSWHDRCYLVPDVAFLFSIASEAKGIDLLQLYNVPFHKGIPLLGVTLINWEAQNRDFLGQTNYETAVAATIRTFVTRYHGQAILFSQVRGPTHAEDDRIPARRVHQQLSDLGSQVIIIEEDVAAATLKSAYKLMDIFIGTRLHSNIFALSAGTPAVMIQYQYKTRGVVQLMGLEDWVIDIENIHEPSLTSMVLDLWENREMIAQQIQAAVTRISEQVAQVGELIAEDVKALR